MATFEEIYLAVVADTEIDEAKLWQTDGDDQGPCSEDMFCTCGECTEEKR